MPIFAIFGVFCLAVFSGVQLWWAFTQKRLLGIFGGFFTKQEAPIGFWFFTALNVVLLLIFGAMLVLAAIKAVTGVSPLE